MNKLKEFLFTLLFFYKEKFYFLLKIPKLKRKTVEGNKGVNFAGYLSTESGVGEGARSIVRILEHSQIPFVLNNINQRWLRSKDNTYSHLYSKENPYCINILHINADMIPYIVNKKGIGWFTGHYNIGYWVWELEIFPAKWKSCFKCFNEIWTASDFCRHSISHIAPIPVSTLPHSIEVKINREYNREFWGLENDIFVFLFIFDFMSGYERKNPLSTIFALKKAFDKKELKKIILILKIGNIIKNKKAYYEILKASEGLPVRVIENYLDKDQYYSLILNCNCYISLHRAEGFGIPLAEAMYLSKPVIATAYSGNMEFMNKENSLLVKYKMEKINKTAGPYKKNNYWAEPDIEHAAKLMRYIFENKEKAVEIGQLASEHIKKNFSPVALKGIIEDKFKEIFEIYCV